MAELLRRVSELAGSSAFAALGSDVLTSRELQIVRLIANGLTNQEIAAHLAVALSTVKNHIHNVFEKLQISGRAEAAAWARRQNTAKF
jgi:DNA-binding NarL/FixJ family response regulator